VKSAAKWLTSYAPQDIRAALAQRLKPSEAIDVATDMLNAIPNGGGNVDRRAYLSKIAATLMEYPPCIARKAADPVRGVPAITEFLPTPAVIIKWAEREREALEEIVRRDDIARKTIEDRKHRTEQDTDLAAKRGARPGIEELKKRYGPNWGFKDLDAVDQARGDDHEAIYGRQLERKRLAAQATEKLIYAEYDRLGIEPVVSGGILISPSLLRSVKKSRDGQVEPAPERTTSGEVRRNDELVR
jgi:hypothetical protein